MPDGPLSGIRVCDLTRILAGPYASMRLGDMGADVIKVERPGAGDDTRAWGPPWVDERSAYFLSVNRSKRSLTLDLKRGGEVLERLIRGSDILIENFRPGTLERLGFGWERLQELNPRLIYGSISGTGHLGSRRREASYDVIIQGETGVQDITGFPDGPPTRIGVSLADLVAGQNLVEGVLLALWQRQRTGRGERVDIALTDGMLSLLTYHAQGALSAGATPRRLGNAHPSIVPYQAFEAADGLMNVGVANEGLWRRLCELLGEPSWVADPRFATNADRVAHRELLIGLLSARFALRPRDAWLAELRAAGIPAGPVRSVGEALEEARGEGRGMVCEAGDLEMVGHPVKLASWGLERRYEAPPELGADSAAILAELGYSDEEVAALRREAIV